MLLVSFRATPEPFTDAEMGQQLRDARNDLLLTFGRLLDDIQPRDDYRELLELSVIILGGVPDRGIKIQRPEAMHRARWMAKAIYAVKIHLFRRQFKLTAAEGSGILRVAVFVVSIYITAWFKAPLPAAAPAHDLAFLKSLLNYQDKALAKATATVFGRHLWYLSERLVGLAFYDREVPMGVKRDMVRALEEEGSVDSPRRATVELASSVISTKNVANFVTAQSVKFFQILCLDSSFLIKDPSQWEEDAGYIEGKNRVNGLHVINDFAERGVALMQDYNLALTKDEDQRQYLLQVVEDHRKMNPDARKSTVTNN